MDKVKQLELAATDLLVDTYGGFDKIELPVNLGKIIERYQLKLVTSEFNDERISGIYSKPERTIYITEGGISTRKAFTIAHELAHFFLHNQKQAEVFYRTDGLVLDQEASIVEREANVFAAALLMPEALVKSYWSSFKSIHVITQAFYVTYSAAYFRLLNLGIIQAK